MTNQAPHTVPAPTGNPGNEWTSGVEETAPALSRPRIMTQTWADLAFLHWFVPPAAVAPYLPSGTAPDLVPGGKFAGLTPVALVPFRMVGAGFGGGPSIGYFGTFWETNVRLYSTDSTGQHGVVFRSLDASRLAVVLGARLTLALPYRFSRMRGYRRHRLGADEWAWTTQTRWPAAPGPDGRTQSHSRIVIRVGEVIPTDPLAAFVTARWGLHTRVLGRTRFIPNEHGPWPLRSAELLLLDDELLGAAGFADLAGRPPDHVCFTSGVRTGFGLPRKALSPDCFPDPRAAS